jgi:hypothetical protein
MAIRVKKRYDARQYVAGAWGLGLVACGLWLFFIIPDPRSVKQGVITSLWYNTFSDSSIE